MKKIMIVLVILAFAWLTAIPIMEFGYIGFFTQSINNSGNRQIFIDLAIANGLIMIWLFQDAKKNHIPSIPYIIIIIFMGSFGSLFYLLHREFVLGASTKE